MKITMLNYFRYIKEYTFSYVDVGCQEGLPVLVQHGMVASIKDIHLFQHLIDAGRRVIAMARPGYGDSVPYVMNNIREWGEIIAALVERLGLEQFDVLGISSGAPYAYAIGYALPEQARCLYILSGIPALYDESVASAWRYPVERNASLEVMRALAYDLFFAQIAPEARLRDDVKDSLRNDCFGLAQDLRLRGMDWEFRLQDVGTRVWMRHSRTDNFEAAKRTASLLPNCWLDAREDDPHFSQEVLDEFIDSVILRPDR